MGIFSELLVLFIILTVLIIMLGFSLLAAHIIAMHRLNK
jgi:hypothetical protein